MLIPFLSFSKKLTKYFSLRDVVPFWYRRYKVFLFLGFLVVLSIGGWNWYQSLYRYQFSDDEKKQYIDSYFKETSFEEAKFRQTVDDMIVRAQMHEEALPLTRNIFEGVGVKPKK